MNQPGNNGASLADATRFLSLLAQPGEAFELRALTKGSGQPYINSGYFDDMGELARAAMTQSGQNDGVYITINPVHPGLLSRKAKNKVHRAGGNDTTSDRDLVARRHLLVDVDAVRPAGISSTDEEHAASIALANRIADDLRGEGWPEPIRADSGNGGHLIYAIDLPVDDGQLVKRVLGALSGRYSTSQQKVDQAVFNPARISKIYGTLTRKGENTVDRPHRYSKILNAPDALVVVPRQILEAFAPALAKSVAPRPASSYRPTETRTEFDLDAWIARYLPDAIAMSWSEGRKWLLPVCPFNSDHNRKEAYVTEKHGGMIAAGCQHESCFKSWKDLREHFEPDAYARREPEPRGPVEVQRADGSRYLAYPDVASHDRVEHAPEDKHAPEVVYQDVEYAAREAEIDAIAARDREPEVPPAPRPPVWFRGTELAAQIWARKDDPWISLILGPDELCRIRAGGTAVVMGGSGSGKSSLVTGFMLEHAINVGPAIAMSIELPADEFGARGVGMKCDSSWEDVLRGNVPLDIMTAALNLPRLYVLERDHATIENLRACVLAAATEFPGQPILVAIDYAQLLQSKEREIRMRVSDAFAQIDRAARDLRFVALAVSQMSRAGADAAKSGEKIGADAASLGAESAAIERFATITLTIGQKGEPREDGSQSVELSLGKGRMSGGDVVFPANFWGKSGRWRLAGDATSAAKVRETRDVEREERKQNLIETAILGEAAKSNGPLSRESYVDLVHVGSRPQRKAAINALIARGLLVEVNVRAPRSKAFTFWTPEKTKAAGLQTRAEASAGEP